MRPNPNSPKYRVFRDFDLELWREAEDLHGRLRACQHARDLLSQQHEYSGYEDDDTANAVIEIDGQMAEHIAALGEIVTRAIRGR